MTFSKDSTQILAQPSILLASDSERLGRFVHGLLAGQGFSARFAGDYSQLDALLVNQHYDIVLLEVTGPHAVEDAVAAALRIKRANPRQIVGYLADPALDGAGLAGDAVFPRGATKLLEALRNFFAEENAC